MKKTNFILLSTLALSTLALPVLVQADDNIVGGSTTTKGNIKFVDGDGDDKETPTNPGDGGTDPVDPGDGGNTKGPLKFVYIPDLDFGSNNVIKTTGNAYYFAKFGKNYINKENPTELINFFEVNDSRGGGKGWTVSLSNDGVFTSADGKSKINANLYLNNISIKSNSNIADEFKPEIAEETFELQGLNEKFIPISSETGSNVELLKASAEKKQGYGSWAVRLGSSDNRIEQEVEGKKTEERNKAIVLEVLPGMKDTTQGYTTDLVWSISTTK